MRPNGRLLLFALALCASASGLSAHPLRVGIYQNVPKIFRDEAGAPSGFWPELVEATFDELGHGVEWVDCEWAQCLELLARGNIDVLPDVAFSEERASMFRFAEHPVLYSWSTILLTGETRVDDISDLFDLRVAVVQDSIQARRLFKMIEQADNAGAVIEYPSMQEAADALMDATVDAAIVNSSSARQVLDSSDVSAANIPFKVSALHFAMPPDAPAELADALDVLIYQQQLDPQSAFHQAERRWISQSVSAVPDWIVRSLAVGLALIGLALATIYFLRQTVRQRTAALEESVANLEWAIAQRKRAENQLLESQHMEALGRLVGGVAHDFNNLLAVILGNLELIDKGKLTKDDVASVDDAINATGRGAELTKQLLAYGRRAALNPTTVDVNTLLADVDRLIRRVMPATIDIKFVRAEGLWATALDVTQFETAILNLSINARDAMPEGGVLTIQTANVRLDDAYINDRAEDIEPGRYILLAVSDTGTGMPKDVLAKVFEPFFTTKPVGRGSGMGLPMVYGFVKQSGGAIRVHSDVDTGSTFKLYFPFVNDVAERTEAKPKHFEGRGEGHILLVEDEADVRQTIARQLRLNGYTVTEAECGVAALALVTSEDVFDLVLTDIVMPGEIQGPKLAHLLRQKFPGLPIVFMSGYPKEAETDGPTLRPGDIQLMKPVRYAELLGAISKILDP